MEILWWHIMMDMGEDEENDVVAMEMIVWP